MNKKLTAFFTERGLTVTGNKAYGKMNGFETNVRLDNFNNVSPLQIHISFYATDEQKRAMADELRRAAYKFFNFQFTAYGLMLGLNGMTCSSLCKRLPEMTDNILSVISQNGGLNGVCPVCGKEIEEGKSRSCTVDGATITMDEECIGNINAVIEAENREFEQAPNNYLFGFFGALIGGIAGGLVSALLYWIGFVASASAIIAVVLGAFLYQKFHGKPNKMMIVIVSVTSLVCMALSVFFVYLAAAGIAVNEVGADMSAMEAFVKLMQSTEVLEDMNRTFAEIFYTDLALVLLFSAVGIGLEIFVLAKKIKRKKTIG